MLLSVLTHHWPLTHYLLHVCSQLAWVIKGITMTIHATLTCVFNKLHDYILDRNLVWHVAVRCREFDTIYTTRGANWATRYFSQGYWCINSCGEY